MSPETQMESRPKTVALLGLGRSMAGYVGHKCQSSLEIQFDEVWTVNFGMDVFRHDKLFLMDDMRLQSKDMPFYEKAMKEHDKVIITSKAYEEFPQSWEFPVKEVIEFIGDDFLNSSVAYAIAWAMFIGVKDISLYGCDFHYPDMNRRELGGQCAAYLLGLARHFGMTYHLPQGTTLLSAHEVVLVNDKPHRRLYGYAKQPFIPEEIEENATDSE